MKDSVVHTPSSLPKRIPLLEYVAMELALLPGGPEHTLSKEECEVIPTKEYLSGLSNQVSMNRVTDHMRRKRQQEPILKTLKSD